MHSPLLSVPGAVEADAPDAGVAMHYGDPFREQRALAEDVGIVDRSHRSVLRIAGADRLDWLHSLTSQHLSGLPAMQGAETLILDPQGRVEHHLLVLDDGEATWIDVEPGAAPSLVAYLDSMRFLLRVEVADVTADWAVLSLVGPGTDRVLGALGIDLGPTEYAAATSPAGGLVRRMPWPGADAADLLIPRRHIGLAAGQQAAQLAGMWAFEALRVEAGRPRLGVDTDSRTIPHEVGWIDRAVHLDKGCYRGQETVARVHNLGHPPRRLVRLHLDGSADSLPGTGDDVTLDGRSVGRVGTSVQHFELGPVALALVKRTTPDDAELLAGGVPARLETIVRPDVGLGIRPKDLLRG